MSELDSVTNCLQGKDINSHKVAPSWDSNEYVTNLFTRVSGNAELMENNCSESEIVKLL